MPTSWLWYAGHKKMSGFVGLELTLLGVGQFNRHWVIVPDLKMSRQIFGDGQQSEWYGRQPKSASYHST
jgi:hypothetical protein